MRYKVLMNNNYMNSFRFYHQAKRLADELRKKFKNCDIEIKEIRK